MNVRLAIFDLDGVIVDTAKYHFLAWRRLADQLGIPFSEQDNERLKGVSRLRSLDILLELGNKQQTMEQKQELAARKNAWYLECVAGMDDTEILPGVLTFLSDLQARNVKTALGSASKNAQTILEKIGLRNHFDAVVDGNLVSKAKPDPEVFLLAAQMLDIPPTQALVFEDAAAGVAAARRAGMIAIGVGDPLVLQEAQLTIPGFAGLTWEQLSARLIQKR